MKKTSLLIIAIIGSILFSCQPEKSVEKGDGMTENRILDSFSRLKVSGIVNLYLSQGDEESIRIEGDTEWIDKLQVQQRGDLLTISLEDGKNTFGKNDKLEVHLQFQDLSELEFEGAGQIKSVAMLELDDLLISGKGVGNIVLEMEAEKVEAKLNFVGSMELKGAAQELYLENEGVGNIDAAQLICQKVEMYSSGIGMISVHAEEELILNVSGIGAVNYKGNPKKVTENVSGLGKVNRN